MSAIDVLYRVPLFADLHEEELSELSTRLGKRTFAEDMILFHKGSPGQALYLIESGSVRAFALSDEGHAGHLRPGRVLRRDRAGRRPDALGRRHDAGADGGLYLAAR